MPILGVWSPLKCHKINLMGCEMINMLGNKEKKSSNINWADLLSILDSFISLSLEQLITYHNVIHLEEETMLCLNCSQLIDDRLQIYESLM